MLDGVGRGIDTQDTCELSGEADQAAVLPTALMAGDGFREGLNQAGAIGAEDSHDDGMAHGWISTQAAVEARTKRREGFFF
jgi:hypothetical protein